MALLYPPSTNGLQKTLGAQLDQGVTASLTLNNATNIQNKPGVCVIDRIDTDGNLKNVSVREFIQYTGTSGSTLTGLTRNVDNSSSDQDHAVGAVVEFIPDVTWGQAIMDVLDGTSTDGVFNSPEVNGSLSGDAILDEDNMASDSAVKLATQQSIKAYVDTNGLITTTKYAPQGFLLNGKISVSVASNNITVAIKGMDGNDPSSTNKVYVRIGDTVRTLTAALSVTKNAGTNWFNAGSSELATKEIDYFVYLGYNATDGVTIGFSRIPYAKQYSDFSTTTTNEKYAAISTITTAASTDYYENIGRFAATLSAGAGYTWTVPTFTALNLIQRPIYETRELSWLPTVTGSGSMTTSSLSVIRGVYKIIHDRVFTELAYTVTTGGTASTNLLNTMPFSRSASSNNLPIGSGAVGDGAAPIQTYFCWNGTSTTQSIIAKYNTANYALISVTLYGVNGVYSI